MDIQTEHMKNRCYFISVMCGMSLYSWYNYSLFDPINNSIFTPYYQNGLLFIFYLVWDTYHMIDKAILYRTDLIIHHTISLILTTSSINNNTLQLSNYMILECVSLMNYIWRNNPNLLKVYRTLCIFCIRLPMTFWMWYYTLKFMYPYWKVTLTYNHYLYMKTLYSMAIFFVFYDMFILWKLYKPKKVTHLKN